jgi:hypothetical protein
MVFQVLKNRVVVFLRTWLAVCQVLDFAFNNTFGECVAPRVAARTAVDARKKFLNAFNAWILLNRENISGKRKTKAEGGA